MTTTTTLYPSTGVPDTLDAGVRRTAARRWTVAGWFVLPATALMLVFFVYPLIFIVWNSFAEPRFGLGNYTALLHDGVSVTVLFRTLRVSLIITVSCLVIGYGYAYAMTRVSARVRGLLVLLVLLPFWTSLMARNFAWYVLESRGGVIDRFFTAIGIPDVVLLGTIPGVTVAMVQVMLPFMILPLYTNMQAIDRTLIPVAGTLGATRWSAFWKVYAPLSVPGILSGCSLVFVLSLGFYITPILLGTPQEGLISQVIGTAVLQQLNFASGGALGTVLLLVTLVVLYLMSKVTRLVSKRWGSA